MFFYRGRVYEVLGIFVDDESLFYQFPLAVKIFHHRSFKRSVFLENKRELSFIFVKHVTCVPINHKIFDKLQ